MPQQVQGIIARSKGAPVELVTINVPDPGRARPWSRSRRAASATPTCTTTAKADGDDYPYLLGHEAAGIVEAVGPDVSDVAPGD